MDLQLFKGSFYNKHVGHTETDHISPFCQRHWNLSFPLDEYKFCGRVEIKFGNIQIIQTSEKKEEVEQKLKYLPHRKWTIRTIKLFEKKYTNGQNCKIPLDIFLVVATNQA